MTGRIVLAVSIRTATGGRHGESWDITRGEPMSPDIWRHWRTCVRSRQPGETVKVTVSADGTPVGEWDANDRWPRDSADAIARARNDLQGATA